MCSAVYKYRLTARYTRRVVSTKRVAQVYQLEYYSVRNDDLSELMLAFIEKNAAMRSYTLHAC